MENYTTIAGRCITRGGIPFVTLQKCADVSPTDADTFARAVPQVINSLRDVCDTVQQILDNWSAGDLANAVNNAEEAMQTARTILATIGG
jgi:hypothetical protein